VIETVALTLSPFSASHLLALIQGEEPFQKDFGLPAADGLRAFFVSDDVSPEWLARLNAAPLTPPDPWSHGFAVVHRDGQRVIGSVGFREPPDDHGVVEIGYGIVADYQGHGFATEAVQAVLAWAFGSGQVTLVRAHTLPDDSASTRVLAKCGFARIGEVEDPEDGLVWRWERGNGHGMNST
jgi:RimJ/RimL family protein N-acetyltransferase